MSSSAVPANTSALARCVREFVALKGATTIAACIPARDEAQTIGPIVEMCIALQRRTALDEVVVITDHCEDDTASIASHLGAKVVANLATPGKGQALSCGITTTSADILIFLDGDIVNFSPVFVLELASPIVTSSKVQLVKGAYARSLYGRIDEGGRVTELVARPLLERYYPELANLSQPLAGECAVRRTSIQDLELYERYGVDVALLIDIYRLFGRDAIVEADLRSREHRNRPLLELRGHARDVLDAVITRTSAGQDAHET